LFWEKGWWLADPKKADQKRNNLEMPRIENSATHPVRRKRGISETKTEEKGYLIVSFRRRKGGKWCGEEKGTEFAIQAGEEISRVEKKKKGETDTISARHIRTVCVLIRRGAPDKSNLGGSDS